MLQSSKLLLMGGDCTTSLLTRDMKSSSLAAAAAAAAGVVLVLVLWDAGEFFIVDPDLLQLNRFSRSSRKGLVPARSWKPK
jgi:hypothetical protein